MAQRVCPITLIGRTDKTRCSPDFAATGKQCCQFEFQNGCVLSDRDAHRQRGLGIMNSARSASGKISDPGHIVWVVLTILVGLAMTASISALMAFEQQHIRERFFAKVADDIRYRIGPFLVPENGIRGTRGMVRATGKLENLKPEQFRNYAMSRNIAEEFGGTRGLGLVVRVPAGTERQALAKLRRDGWKIDRFWGFSNHPGDKFIVLAVEPLQINANAIGLDLASEPHRAEAVFRAVRRAGVQLSAPVKLVQGTGNIQVGFLALLPIYDGPAPASEAGRMQQVRGAALMPVIVGERMALFRWPRDQVDIDLVDITDPAKPIPFFSSGKTRAAHGLVHTETFGVLGRTWQMKLLAKPGFDESLQFTPWPVVSGLGLILSLLAGLAVHLSIQTQSRIRGLNRELRDRAELREIELAEARESALAASQGFRTIFDQNPLGIALVYPAEKRTEQANAQFSDFFGDPDAFLAACQWIQGAAEQGGTVQTTVNYTRPDGANIWTRLTLSPIVVTDQGQAERHILMAEDITLEYEQKLKLDELLAQLHLAREAAKIGIWYWNFGDKTVHWDARMFDIFGRSDDWRAGIEASYEYWTKTLVETERAETEKSLEEALAAGRPWERIYRVNCPDGEVRSIEAFSILRKDDNGKAIGMLGICRNVSKRLRLESELVAARIAAESANAAKDQFLANISHELRTPMNAILGMLEVLGQTPLDDVQRRHFTSVHNAARALLRILNDILDFSRLNANALQIVPEDLQIEDLLSQVGELFAVAASSKGVELVLESSSDLAGHYWGDALRIRQILNNFVDNAIKFTDQGSVVVTASRVGAEEDRHRIRFEVRDTGMGLTDEQASRLFQPFVQADQSLTRTHGGSGLGLSICRQLAAAMEGAIGVESKRGQGSTFWFEVPLKPLGGDAAGEAQPLQREHVLIVEDHDDAQRVLLGYLATWGFTGAAVPSVEQAMTRVLAEAKSGNPFTLLILDWKLPDADGLALLDRLHQATREGALNRVPAILMVTAYDRGTLNRAATGHKLISDAILSKPVTATQLHNVIADLQRSGFTERSGAVLDEDERPVAERMKGGRGARLLLVEDNRTNQEVALAMLGQMGMQVDVADNGKQALERLAEQDYDLVLMDVHMPVMNGLDAARAIRTGRWGTRLPIVALTAAAFPEDRKQVAAAGMNDFLSKPVDPQRLAATLLRWLPDSVAQGASLEQAPATHTAKDDLPDRMTCFDLPTVLERFSGDKAILRRVLQAFSEDFRNWEAEADKALAGGDLARLKSLVHSLKGGAGGVGAHHAEQAARQLDDALRQVLGEGQDDPAISSLTGAASSALRAALDELRNTLKIG